MTCGPIDVYGDFEKQHSVTSQKIVILITVKETLNQQTVPVVIAYVILWKVQICLHRYASWSSPYILIDKWLTN
jgi:hypothetical protein